MPKSNETLVHYSVAELNNLFTMVGKDAYDEILKNQDKDKLTPEAFKDLVAKRIGRNQEI